MLEGGSDDKSKDHKGLVIHCLRSHELLFRQLDLPAHSTSSRHVQKSFSALAHPCCNQCHNKLKQHILTASASPCKQQEQAVTWQTRILRKCHNEPINTS